MASAPIVHLHDVDRFARLAVIYLAGRSAPALRQDLMAQHAIAYCLLSLSNAVARIDTENPGFLRDQLRADIAWQYFIEIQIFLGRGFDRLDADALRRTVIDDLPALISVTETYLAEWDDQNER